MGKPIYTLQPWACKFSQSLIYSMLEWNDEKFLIEPNFLIKAL